MSNRQVEALCADPIYVLKLQQRVAGHIVNRRGPGGSAQLDHAFAAVDARHRVWHSEQDPAEEMVHDEAALLSVLRPIFPFTVVQDRDMAALAHLTFADDEEDDRSRPCDATGDRGRHPQDGQRSHSLPSRALPVASYLHVLRTMSPMVSFQLWEALRHARTAVQKLTVMTDFESRLLAVANDEEDGLTTVPVLPEEAQQFLEVVCGLSGSAAQLIAEACTVCGAATDILDAGRFYDLVFLDTMPVAVEFELLARRFAESTAVPLPSGSTGASTKSTGSLALRDALLQMRLSPPAETTSLRTGKDEADEAADFIGVPTSAQLTSRLFFRLCLSLGTGFQQEESDKLFFYLYNERGRVAYDATHHPLLPVRAVLHMFRAHFPAVTLSLAHITRCAVARLVAQSSTDGTAFFRLYTCLKRFGATRVPLADFIAALRANGVPEQTVSDLHLEWLRLQSGRRVELLTALCAPLPPAREAVITKLFDRLSGDASLAAPSPHPSVSRTGTGTVRASHVLARFDAGRMEGKAARALGEKWKLALADYFAELDVEDVPYALFSFIWCLLSAAVEDDALFSLGVWQGFSLAERVGVSHRSGAARY